MAAMLGARLGGYLIIEKLAEGGMGVVYLARSVSGPAHEVVIKVLLPQYTHNARLTCRFLNEARAVASIDHPGVVRVFEVGEQDERVYIAMERLHGETLRERLGRGRFEMAQLIPLIRQLASAVGAAHRRNIIHRDLKPENLFLVPTSDTRTDRRSDRSSDEPGGGPGDWIGGVHGEVDLKVLDFGIAKLAPQEGQEHPTAKGSFFGTPAYMAPEQCQDAGTVDGRADLYAIGCIMYEMICGQPPFGRGGIELLAAQLRDAPPPLHRHVHSVPRDIEALTLRLLAKHPDQRPDSCDALIAELERADLSSNHPPGVLPGVLPVPGPTERAHHPAPIGLSSAGDTTLPAEAAAPVLSVASAPTLPAEAVAPPLPGLSRRPETALRVLIVDDNAMNRRVAEHMVKRLGGCTDVAKNGAVAVAMIQREHYDLVLMDCQMPVLNGYDATRRIRGLGGPKGRVPIVAVTAHRLIESRDKCLDAGMDDYLTKPLRLATLRRTLDKWQRKSGIAELKAGGDSR